MNKILSISIAAYNMEKYIAECLQIIAKCKYKEKLEVFIIDDGGNDNTIEIAKSFQQKYSDVFIPVHKKNGGWGSTLNYAFQHATGKYFKQLDGDDYYDLTGLENLIEYLMITDSDIVYTPFYFIDSEKKNIIREEKLQGGFEERTQYKIEDCIMKINLAMHMCTIKTKLVRDLHILEHCFYTDIQFIINAFDVADTISFLNQDVYCYRISREGQSVSTEGFRRHCLEHKLVLVTMMEYTRKMVDCNKKQAFINRLKVMAGDQYIAYLCLETNKDNKKKLIEFDRELRHEYPEFYDVKSRIAKLCKKSHFMIYRILSYYVQNR